MKTFFLSSFASLLCFFLLSCATEKTVKEDFTGLTGKVSQQAEMYYSKARLLWSVNRNFSRTETETCSNPEEAVTLLNKAIELEPEYTEALIRRSMAQSELKNFKAAFDDATKAIQLSSSPQAYAVRGLVSIRAGNMEVAKKDLEKSLDINSSQYQAWNYLGIMDLLEGNQDNACDNFKNACSNGDCTRLEMLKKEGACQSFWGIF